MSFRLHRANTGFDDLVVPLTEALGVFFALIGLAGFFLGGRYLFSLFEVDFTHNFFHFLTGAAGIAAGTSKKQARLYLMIFGGVYAVVSLSAFLGEGWSLPSLFATNPPDNYLHAIVALLALTVGIAGRWEQDRR